MARIPSHGSASLFDVTIGRWTCRELIETVCDCASAKDAMFITYANAHTINVKARDAQYARVLEQADIVYADGMSIVWASRWLGANGLPERVNAGDFLEEFLRECARRNISIFMIGSAPGVAKRCTERMAGRIDGLRIAGATDGFWGRGGEFESESEVLEAIREAKPDVLLVGMGVPLQEVWTAEHERDLEVPVRWCVGALFEYFSGERARAPHWIRRIGMEWAFRLVLEPRRLARRYLWGNLEFLGHVWRERRRRHRANRADLKP